MDEMTYAQDREAAAAVEAVEAYKRTVVAPVAMKYAITHDWCDVVKTALREMGVQLDNPTITATVVVTYEVEASVPFDHIISFNENPRVFVAQHLHVPSLMVKSDHDAMSVEGEMVDPTSVNVTQAQITEAP